MAFTVFEASCVGCLGLGLGRSTTGLHYVCILLSLSPETTPLLALLTFWLVLYQGLHCIRTVNSSRFNCNLFFE